MPRSEPTVKYQSMYERDRLLDDVNCFRSSSASFNYNCKLASRMDAQGLHLYNEGQIIRGASATC